MASLGKMKKVQHGKRLNANRGRKPAQGKPLSDFKRNTLKKLFGRAAKPLYGPPAKKA